MILQRYVLKDIVLSFVFAFSAVMAVCLVGAIYQVFRQYEGLGLSFLGKILPAAAGDVSPWALLVGTCTATTLTYGRLAAENEITAMQMCGIHLNRVMAPAALLGLLLSAASFYIHDVVSPWAHYKRRMVIRESLLTILQSPPAGAQTFKIGNYRLSYTDASSGRLERPYLVEFEGGLLKMEYHAVSGSIRVDENGPAQIVIVMAKPEYWKYEIKGNPARSVPQSRFAAENDVPISLNLNSFFDAERRSEDVSSGDLMRLAAQTSDRERRREMLTVCHTRYAQGLAPLLLVLISAPIGIFVKKGSRLAGLGASLPPILLYFISLFIFKGMGEKGRIAPTAAAYWPDMILFAVACVLLWKVYRK